MKTLNEETEIRKDSIWYHGSGFNGKATFRLKKPTPSRPLYVTNHPGFGYNHTPRDGMCDDDTATFYIFIMSDSLKVLDFSKPEDTRRLGLPECMARFMAECEYGNDVWGYYKNFQSEFRYLLDGLGDRLLRREPFPEAEAAETIRRKREQIKLEYGIDGDSYDLVVLRQLWDWMSDFRLPLRKKLIEDRGGYRLRPYTLAQAVYEKAKALGYDGVLTSESPKLFEGEKTLVLFKIDHISYVSNFARPLSYRECEDFFDFLDDRRYVSKDVVEEFLKGLVYERPLSYADRNGYENAPKMEKWRRDLAAERR